MATLSDFLCGPTIIFTIRQEFLPKVGRAAIKIQSIYLKFIELTTKFLRAPRKTIYSLMMGAQSRKKVLSIGSNNLPGFILAIDKIAWMAIKVRFGITCYSFLSTLRAHHKSY